MAKRRKRELTTILWNANPVADTIPTVVKPARMGIPAPSKASKGLDSLNLVILAQRSSHLLL